MAVDEPGVIHAPRASCSLRALSRHSVRGPTQEIRSSGGGEHTVTHVAVTHGGEMGVHEGDVVHLAIIKAMKKYFAREALLPRGWARDVSHRQCTKGDIVERTVARKARRLAGPVLPGMANLHSHAFQRAMAGLTETRGPAADDFWTWRELMYRFVERVTPEHAKAIATQLYIEMLLHGYTAVAEFHYVHHPGRHARAHLEAAREAGIAITLLPSLYSWSGFGQKPLLPRQRRFSPRLGSILSDLRSAPTGALRRHGIGVAPHSLRAVDPAGAQGGRSHCRRPPIHIHAAEQTKEVDECKAALGQAPGRVAAVANAGRRTLVHRARHPHDR